MNITKCITRCVVDNDDLIILMPYGVGMVIGGGLVAFILISWAFFIFLLTMKGFRDALCCCWKCKKKLGV